MASSSEFQPRFDNVVNEDDDHSEDSSEMDDELQRDDSGQTEDDKVSEDRMSGVPTATTPDDPDRTLFPELPHLRTVRQRLFEIEDSIELSLDEFKSYFPFVDNIWRKIRTVEAQVDKSSTTEWYWCRLRKDAHTQPHTPKPTPEGKQSRRKRPRNDKTCGMALKVIFNGNPVRMCTITRAVPKGERHTHDLDYIDATKRNSGIMNVARREAIRGYIPTSVFWKMWEEPHKMEDAGGKYMKVSDVRNVQYAWRQDNPTVALQAHPGYSQGRRTARQRPSTPPKMMGIVADQPPSAQPLLPIDTLHYPEHARAFLDPYLPPRGVNLKPRPYITLTWASSLDSQISIQTGIQTAISGPETKAMTHYLRSRHDAILIGVRTAIADDPSLNCRLAGAGGYGGVGLDGQPRPIIIDPHARLHIRPELKILKIVSQGRAKAPWIVVTPGASLHPSAVSTLKSHGGEYLMINDFNNETGGFNWEGIFNVLYHEGIKSIMIEGGGLVLSELLKKRYSQLVDSVITTIAPTFFGKAGVTVCPDPTFDEAGKPIPNRLKNVKWQPMGESDVVMCGHTIPEPLPPRPTLPGIAEITQPPPSSRQLTQHSDPGTPAFSVASSSAPNYTKSGA